MASTSDHIAARNDTDLIARFVAAAEQMGVPDAYSWVQNRMGELITQPVSDDQTVSDVYAYARTVRDEYIRNTPELPGTSLAAVTDMYLKAAIGNLYTPPSA